MKIEYETKFDIGDTVYYVGDDQSPYVESKCEKCNHNLPYNDTRKAKVYKTVVKGFYLSGTGPYRGTIDLDCESHIEYRLDGEIFSTDAKLFATEDMAAKHLEDRNMWLL